jgi:dolichyl-phosphate beta-glucosyltransferase
MTICIVVPCYNEQSRLPVDEFRRYAQQHADDCFLFVNDGSTDGTQDVLETLCRQSDEGNIHCIALPANRGKGEAVRQGVLWAVRNNFTRTGYWDADLATPLSAIHEMDCVLDENLNIDFVHGSRINLTARQMDRTPFRRFSSRCFILITTLLFHLQAKDTQCGAKIMRIGERVTETFSRPFISRWMFDVEVFIRLSSNILQDEMADADASQVVMYEYPLKEWRDIQGSRLRLRDTFHAVWDLLRIRTKYGSAYSWRKTSYKPLILDKRRPDRRSNIKPKIAGSEPSDLF